MIDLRDQAILVIDQACEIIFVRGLKGPGTDHNSLARQEVLRCPSLPTISHAGDLRAAPALLAAYLHSSSEISLIDQQC